MDFLEISNFPHVTPVNVDKHHHQEIAMKLEIAFLSEMLSFVGMKEMTSKFGGGTGEEHFQSFLREQHAKLIVERGGLGLAEQFAHSMAET